MPKDRDDSLQRLESRLRRDEDSMERYRNRRRSWSCSSSDSSTRIAIDRYELSRLKRLADDYKWKEGKFKDRDPAHSNYTHRRRGSSPSSPRSPPKLRKCHHCESTDHMKNNCPLKGIKRCYGCAELGHTRLECPLPLSEQRSYGRMPKNMYLEETGVEGTGRNAADRSNEYRHEIRLKEIETRRSISPRRTTSEQREDKRRKLDDDGKRAKENFEKRQQEIDEQKRLLFEEEQRLKKERAEFDFRKQALKAEMEKKETEIKQTQATLIKLKEELKQLEVEYEQLRTTPKKVNVLRNYDEKFLPPKKLPLPTNQPIVCPPSMGIPPVTTHIASEDQWAWHVHHFLKNTC